VFKFAREKHGRRGRTGHGTQPPQLTTTVACCSHTRPTSASLTPIAKPHGRSGPGEGDAQHRPLRHYTNATIPLCLADYESQPAAATTRAGGSRRFPLSSILPEMGS
jgi:hypothetical protein